MKRVNIKWLNYAKTLLTHNKQDKFTDIMIIAIKTDTDPTELYLLDDSGEKQAEKIWSTKRTLARDLPGKIEKITANFKDLSGIIAYRGPGSFTGLRIGITTANALAYARQIPIVGVMGQDWLGDGVKMLKESHNDKIVMPEYGAPVNITLPKK